MGESNSQKTPWHELGKGTTISSTMIYFVINCMGCIENGKKS
jgi:hypothetical protein